MLLYTLCVGDFSKKDYWLREPIQSALYLASMLLQKTKLEAEQIKLAGKKKK